MKKLKISLCLVCSFVLFSCQPDPAESGSGTDKVSSNSHRAFVTSVSYSGNIGGITGGDTKCATLAKAAGLKRKYMAILSDSTGQIALNRLDFSGAIYVVSDTVKLVASSGSDLWNTDNKNLLNGIDANENSVTVSATPWTGTNTNGDSGSSCSDWTSESVNSRGLTGDTTKTDANWIENVPEVACSFSKPIYCVSQ